MKKPIWARNQGRVLSGVLLGGNNVATGHWKRVQQAGSQVAGITAVVTGQIEEMRALPASAKARVEFQRQFATREHGLNTVEHMRSFLTPEICKARNVRGGQGGSPESHAKKSLTGHHIRWHVKRGIVKSDCKLCQGDQN